MGCNHEHQRRGHLCNHLGYRGGVRDSVCGVDAMSQVRLWKISNPGVDLVLYTTVEPVAGNIIRAGDYYTDDGVRVTHDTIPDGMSAIVSTTKNAELVTDNFPYWFCVMEDES